MGFVWVGLSPKAWIGVNIFQNSRESKFAGAVKAFDANSSGFELISRHFCPWSITVMLSGIIRAIFLCIFSRERPFMALSHVRRARILSNQRARKQTVCHSTHFIVLSLANQRTLIYSVVVVKMQIARIFATSWKSQKKIFFLRPTHHVCIPLYSSIKKPFSLRQF